MRTGASLPDTGWLRKPGERNLAAGQRQPSGLGGASIRREELKESGGVYDLRLAVALQHEQVFVARDQVIGVRRQRERKKVIIGLIPADSRCLSRLEEQAHLLKQQLQAFDVGGRNVPSDPASRQYLDVLLQEWRRVDEMQAPIRNCVGDYFEPPGDECADDR